MQMGVGAAEGWAGNCPELGREITIPHSIGVWAAWLPLPQPPDSWDGTKKVNSNIPAEIKVRKTQKKKKRKEKKM